MRKHGGFFFGPTTAPKVHQAGPTRVQYFRDICRIIRLVAQVAKLVDAPASGAGVRKDVEVRVFSWAPQTDKPPCESMGAFSLGNSGPPQHPDWGRSTVAPEVLAAGLNQRPPNPQIGNATRSCPCVPTMRARVNSPTLSVLLIFSGGNNFTVPSISGASA